MIRLYELTIRAALRRSWVTLGLCVLILLAGLQIYGRLESEFLPPMDEGGFVIDYQGRPGTSLAQTDQMLMQAEQILRTVPDVESYSRRTGARLALAIAEPHTGDFLVKLKPDRQRSTEHVISDLRQQFNTAVPGLRWEFPGILGDLIGDLMWAPAPHRDQAVLDGHRLPQEEGSASSKRASRRSRGLSIPSMGWSTRATRSTCRSGPWTRNVSV